MDESRQQPGHATIPAVDEFPYSQRHWLILGAAALLTLISITWACTRPDSTDQKQVIPAKMATAELLAKSPSVDVCEELLKRDLSTRQLQSTLSSLARLKRTTSLHVLCHVIENLPESADRQWLGNLNSLLTEINVPRRHRIALMEDQKYHQSASSYTVALSVIAALREDITELLESADTPATQIQIIDCVSLVSRIEVQAVLYAQVRTILLDEEAPAELRTAAFRTTGLLDAVPQERASDLIRLIGPGEYAECAMTSLKQIPATDWPEEQLGRLASKIIACIATQMRAVDAESGKLPPFVRSAMNLAAVVSKRLPAEGRDRFDRRIEELTHENFAD